MALGATRVSVGLLVLKQTITVGCIGLVIGAIGSTLLGRALSAYLFGILPADPVTFLCATGALATMFSWLPSCLRCARRKSIRWWRFVMNRAQQRLGVHGPRA